MVKKIKPVLLTFKRTRFIWNKKKALLSEPMVVPFLNKSRMQRKKPSKNQKQDRKPEREERSAVEELPPHPPFFPIFTIPVYRPHFLNLVRTDSTHNA